MAANSAIARLNDKLSSSNGGLTVKEFKKQMTDIQRLLRNYIISLACSSGNQDCLQEANNQFKQFLTTGQPIGADIRANAYKYGIQVNTNDNEWNQVLDLWLTEVSSAEKSKLLTALTSVDDSQLLSKLIAKSEDAVIVNDQDFFTFQQSIAANSLTGRQLVWNYMRQNWHKLVDRFKINDRRLGSYITSVTNNFNTETQLNELKAFFAENPESGATENARKQALERVQNNIKWSTTHEESVIQWLNTNSPSVNPWLNWRLDPQVVPQAYKVHWTIDLSADTFSGTVRIEVNVKKPIKQFVLHSKGLTITESKAYLGDINSADEKPLNEKSEPIVYADNDFYVIPTDTTIRADIYHLYLEFNGKLSTGLNGLYKSVYTDSTGTSKSLATTQFQSTYARQALPCFDEPQFKATFDITITHSAQYNVISNMPVRESVIADGGLKVTKFDPSVKMVTYLVALVVSDFECFVSPSDKRVRVCGAPGNKPKLDYALDKTPAILKFYESEYFQIPYPLPKLDNIAVPDFSAGAMENWGLVTYREVYLFYDETESTTKSQMQVCMIIAHELAHMWFGNLVTTKWWDDLWLNEGFATYMSYKAVGKVETEWKYDEIFALDELSRVFEADSTPNTHPIVGSVQNADDISSVFDAITYGKGAAILRMLETALGDDFRIGIKNYLIKHSYENTLTEDLWTQLTQDSQQRLNVSEIMETWVTRKGFPVVTVTRSDTNPNQITLKQELFLKDYTKSNTSYVWKIPITYSAPGAANSFVYTEWLDDSEQTIDLKTTSDLININVGQTGLYIVNYAVNDWKEWTKELLNEKSRQRLSPLDRSELINDAFYLARSGRLDYDIALDLSKYLKAEDSLIPWTTAQTMLGFLKNLINSDAEIALNHYISGLIGDQYTKLGWNEVTTESGQIKRLRTVVLDMACGYQMPECVQTAVQKFNEWKTSPTIAPNLLSLVLKYGIRYGGDTEFKHLMDEYQKPGLSAQKKLLYLQGLTSTGNKDQIAALLAKAEDESFLRKHDFFQFLTNLAVNSLVGRDMVWDYYRNNYNKIVDRFTINNSGLGRIVYTLSTLFTSDVQKAQVLDFFKQYPNAGAGKLDREKAVEVLDTNINWIKNNKNKVIEWITTQCPSITCPWITYRLDRQVIPLQYYLTLQVNTVSNEFSGNVEIEVKTEKDVEYFIVHSADILTIKKTRVLLKGSETDLAIKQTFHYSPLQFFVIRMDTKTTANTYRLIFEYESNLLLGGLSGLYKSSYELDGKTIGLAASQFQSTSARKAFPSFDEPSFRSEFDLTVIHDSGNTLTITNMPITGQQVDVPTKGWTTTKYQRSKPMVTYLVAIMVSDFVCRTDNSHDLGYVIRVCASPAKQHKLQYALDVTPKVFDEFEKYLDFKYQLPKSDLVAIPDFSAGAMENWGLVKFRETALLWTADEDNSASKMSVASIIAHELAHMWFGNMLTCEFWGDLWLNEGFASYMEYPATAMVEKTWDYVSIVLNLYFYIWDLFVFYDLSSAVSADSSPTSQPIVRILNKPSDMSYSSAIVYNKGSTVIRMMERAMGPQKFQTGIQKYLKANQYTTVITQKLWDLLQEEFPTDLGTTIKDLMHNWVTEAGFPYINITRDETDANKITIIQERFLANGQKPDKDTVWSIPLSYYHDEGYDQNTLTIVKTKTQTIDLVNIDPKLNGLIKFNTDYSGMYFVNYPLDDWDKWSKALVNNENDIVNKLSGRVHHGRFLGMYFVNYPLDDWDKWSKALVNNENDIVNKLSVSDRAEFIMDAFYLAKANKLPLVKALDISKYLVHEPHFTPWSMYRSMFDQDTRDRLAMSQYRDSLNRFLSFLTEKQYKRLGWNDGSGDDTTGHQRQAGNEPIQGQFEPYKRLGWNDGSGDDTTKRLRAVIVEMSCDSGYRQCLEEAYKEFTQWKSGAAKLSPNLGGFVLSFGLRQSTDPNDFEEVWKKYKDANKNDNFKLRYLTALSKSKNSEQLKDILVKALDDKVVSVSHFQTLLSEMAKTPEGLPIAWDFFQNNYQMLTRKLSANDLNNVFNNIIKYFGDVVKRSEVDTFLRRYPNVGLSNTNRENGLNRIQQNMDWIFERGDDYGKWLTANGCGINKECPWSIYRLDFTVKPIKYKPTIRVNVTTNVYNGNVDIEVQTTNPTEYFIVHASSILNVIKSQVFVKSDNKEIPVVNAFHHKPHDFWVIQLAQEVAAGTYRLVYEFEGNLLLGGLSGLYRSNYVNSEGKTVGLASTQFEFTDARKAFPCFDEPSFKSIFEVTLIHDEHMSTTLSNMPVAKSTTDPETRWVTTQYKETPVPMVTYLVAMVVSDFVCHQSKIDSWDVGVCASAVQSDKLEFAAESTRSVLHYLAKDYTAMDYPLPKVDMIGIPDFAYGAMENWGLVTFKESRLVWQDQENTSANKMSVLAIIAHELAHFWFGNVVTCHWWSDFWLNEGFATFFEHKAVANSQPDWQYADLFMTTDYMTALNADSVETSHPLVRKTVESPQDVQRYSSSIVYSKDLLTALKDSYQYNDPDDPNIYDLMNAWTEESGYPYITVTKSDTPNKYTIVQNRYLSNGKLDEKKTKWIIPLSYYERFDTKKTTLVFVKEDTKDITITLDASAEGLIKFNTDGRGMYLINYPEEEWDKWTDALITNKASVVTALTPSDRANLFIDAHFLAKANIGSVIRPLQLAQYLAKEKHYVPWTVAIESFKQIQKYMLTTERRDELQKFFRDLGTDLYNELGWDDTGTDTHKRLRSTIIELMCSQYHEPCLKKALEEFEKFKSVTKWRPNLLAPTLRYAMRQSADRSDWDYLWTKYVDEKTAIVKNTHLNALSYTRDPILIKTLLDRSLDSKLVTNTEVTAIINNLGANWDALQILWDYFKDNHKRYQERLSTIQLGSIFNSICSYFTTADRRREVENFLAEDQTLGIANYDKNRAIDTINANIQWLTRNKDRVINFLECRSASCPWTSYRLDEKITPNNYALEFNIDVEESTFTGTANIDVTAGHPTQYFIVHAADTLDITSSVVKKKGTAVALEQSGAPTRNARYELFVIKMKDIQPADEYILEFVFKSKLNENMDGLYKSTYYKDGKPVGLAATQFQATSARKAFPCFDEPSFRSTFEMTITSKQDKTLTISNNEMEGTPVINADGTQTIKYKKTPPMVTYLLAMVVSDFVCQPAAPGVVDYTVRVCASSVEQQKVGYSLAVTPQVMNYYDGYFGHKYSQHMPKADYIAIPDFSAGAMENWGLITFRETGLLWHEKESTSANKMAVIAVIAHETVHMWFGNLFTCKWWSDLWLNEAFASYLEYTAVNHVEPTWNYFDLFLMTDTLPALTADSSATSHPIVRPVTQPEERSYTSAIVYNKGSSILRMLESVMGSTEFQSALKAYVSANVLKTVETKDLFDKLNEIFSQKDKVTIHDLMDTWVTKAGFPYVNITRDPTTPNKITVIQERFLANGQTLDSDTIWTIPLTYYKSLAPKATTTEFIKTKTATIDTTVDTTANGLLKINTNSDGFYFVNYPEEDWSKWTRALVNNDNDILTQLTVSDRTNFITDSFYLSRAGLLSYVTPLELAKYLKRETHLTPWSVAISLFAPIRRSLSSTEHKEGFDQYLNELAKERYEALKWDETTGETDVVKRLRSNIVDFVCANNYKPCLTDVQQKYYEWRANPTVNYKPNIMSTVLKYAIKQIGLTTDWDNLWDVYLKETSTVLKLTYLNALSFTSNTDLINKLLDLSLDVTKVRKQDYLSVLNYIISNPDGLQVIWDYYRNNYEKLLNGGHLSVGQLGTVVNNICNYFNDETRKKEVNE
ncbi:unnamed protein product, partial [Medioppia subpectinata]